MPLQQPRPSDAGRSGLDSLELAVGRRSGFGGLLALIWWPSRQHLRPKHRVRGQHAVEPDEMQSWPRHQRGQLLHELQRAHHHARGSIAP